jgi:anaerobic selenocysteine-containing dehydrogenase
MANKRRRDDYDESGVVVGEQDDHAAGPTAVAVSLKRAVERMGPFRTGRTLLHLNQAEGFDCMSCAWPDPEPGHRSVAEFCENGAKAVAEEATKDRATPEFFAAHSIEDLDAQSEMWLGQQGRITHPMIKRPGDLHYRPISWDEAFRLVADELNALDQLSAPTTCRTARTCATSRPPSRCRSRSGSARPASRWTTSTRPS